MNDFKNNEFHNLEDQTKDIFRKKGYSVHMPATSNDQGIDMIAENHFEKIAVQVTHFPETTFDKSVNGARLGRDTFDCNRAVIVVDGDIQPDFKDMANKNHIEVLSIHTLDSSI